MSIGLKAGRLLMSKKQSHFHNSDHRAQFANSVLKLLWKKHGSHCSADLLEDVAIQREYFDEYVRNIYEVINDEIPLFAWHDVVKHGHENVDWECSHKEALRIIFAGCEEFYN